VVAEARRTRPDVALLDVEMPGLDGIAATADLRAALPGCRVLVVTTFGRPGAAARWRRAVASWSDAGPPARRRSAGRRGLRVVDPTLAAETLAAGQPLDGGRPTCSGGRRRWRGRRHRRRAEPV
jgi:two-component system response regulator DesR